MPINHTWVNVCAHADTDPEGGQANHSQNGPLEKVISSGGQLWRQRCRARLRERRDKVISSGGGQLWRQRSRARLREWMLSEGQSDQQWRRTAVETEEQSKATRVDAFKVISSGRGQLWR